MDRRPILVQGWPDMPNRDLIGLYTRLITAMALPSGSYAKLFSRYGAVHSGLVLPAGADCVDALQVITREARTVWRDHAHWAAVSFVFGAAERDYAELMRCMGVALSSPATG